MSNVATINPPRSVLLTMSERYGMEPQAFEQTLRATVFPANGTKEQFAAFLLVAKEYYLNPLLKEIYAFPARNGGIQPIVPIDGWTNIINSNPQLDGIEFDDHLNEHGIVTAITCRIFRKDRAHPIVVTEYMDECARSTETWKQWPRRMLRHKALIQCARYAFGLAGIVDPDEAERIRDVNEMKPVGEKPRTVKGVLDHFAGVLDHFAGEPKVEEAETVGADEPKKKRTTKKEAGLRYEPELSATNLNAILEGLSAPMSADELREFVNVNASIVQRLIPEHQRVAEGELAMRAAEIIGGDELPTFLGDSGRRAE